MADEPRKRSRFDQGDSEPSRRSRFDRRSRSPAQRDSEPRRSRSPIQKSVENTAEVGEKKPDAAAAAAAAAARINASISAKKGVQSVDVPPIRNPSQTFSPTPGAGGAKSPSGGNPSGTLNVEIYQQDGDYIKDIEVNDLRNRYTLTKGSTQKQIKDLTGADVTTRGNYYPDKSMATAANPPLYLHITSTSKEGLEKAVKHIEELMKQELPNLIDERRFRRREQPQEQQVERDSLGRRKWPEERIPVDLEPIPGFNLRAQVVGSGGSFVKHIQGETRCRVQIKGRGSGFVEHDTHAESDEPMYLHVAGPDPSEVQRAKELCESLLESVRNNYEKFKEERSQRSQYGGGTRGGYQGDRGGGGYHDRERNGSAQGYGNGGDTGYGGVHSQQSYDAYGAGSYAAAGAGGAQSPSAAAQQPSQSADPAEQQRVMQAWMQYYAEHPDQDPYASYGGYALVMASYYSGQPSEQQQGQAQHGQPGYGSGDPTGQNGSVPPPQPPPDSGTVPPPPPPPPPPGSAGGAYSSVPPPPGL